MGILLTLVAIAGWFLFQTAKTRPIIQPVAFSHATHIVKEELECRDCHEGEETVKAGFASIKECYQCHEEPQGKHPDEEKVIAYGEKGHQIPFIQVNRNVGHVYFSHRAHVRFGEMKCEDCHGDMKTVKTPVSVPTPSLHSMGACIDCHRKRGASLECASCHK